MHLTVGALRVLGSSGIVGAEVRSLRGMGDDVIGTEICPELLGESDQPIFTTAVALQESRSVLPIDVHTVKMVILDEISQSLSAVMDIIPRRSRILSGSESTHEQFNTSIGVLLLESSLDLLVGVSEDSCSNVVEKVAPDQSGIDGSASVCPESERDIVEGKSSGGVAGDGEALGDCRWRPPLGKTVDVGQSDGDGCVDAGRFYRDGTFLVEVEGLSGCQQADAHYGSDHNQWTRIKSHQIQRKTQAIDINQPSSIPIVIGVIDLWI